MNMIERCGIRKGQVYHAADGSEYTLGVVDIVTHAECDDVIVAEMIGGHTMEKRLRIDAWKLARCRYYLCEEGCRGPD